MRQQPSGPGGLPTCSLGTSQVPSLAGPHSPGPGGRGGCPCPLTLWDCHEGKDVMALKVTSCCARGSVHLGEGRRGAQSPWACVRWGGCWQSEDVGHTLLVLSGVLGFADQRQPGQPKALQGSDSSPWPDKKMQRKVMFVRKQRPSGRRHFYPVSADEKTEQTFPAELLPCARRWSGPGISQQRTGHGSCSGVTSQRGEDLYSRSE